MDQNHQQKSAVRRLLRDLSDLQRNPLPLVSARPLPNNLFKWHVNLCGPSNTAYEGGIFHIELVFPGDYPCRPPSATVFTSLPHPHVIDGRICLDLLGDYAGYFYWIEIEEGNTKKPPIQSNQLRYSSSIGELNDYVKEDVLHIVNISTGWSTAYCVRTILLQLQAFLMELSSDDEKRTKGWDKSMSQYLQEIPRAIAESLRFTCPIEGCSHHPKAAWPRIIDSSLTLPESGSHRSDRDRVYQELVCFHSKRHFADDILGIGFKVGANKDGIVKVVESDLDVVSYTAFFDEGVKWNVLGEATNHWIPLYIDEGHWRKARRYFERTISYIYHQQWNQYDPKIGLEFLSSAMNSMVVQIMKGDKRASTRAIEGYLAFLRLSIELVLAHDDVRGALEQSAQRFKDLVLYRHKYYVPALGNFLCLLPLVNGVSWGDVKFAYLEECFSRNASWVGARKNPAYMKKKDVKMYDKRPFIFWDACRVSLRLLCFHVSLLQHLRRPTHSLEALAEQLDKLYSFPSHTLCMKIQEDIVRIQGMNHWKMFFQYVGIKNKSMQWVKQALHRSIDHCHYMRYDKAFNKADYEEAVKHIRHRLEKSGSGRRESSHSKSGRREKVRKYSTSSQDTHRDMEEGL